MNDPTPENITGEKRVSHVVKHQINWGYVAVAVAALIVLVYVDPLGKNQDSDGRQE